MNQEYVGGEFMRCLRVFTVPYAFYGADDSWLVSLMLHQLFVLWESLKLVVGNMESFVDVDA